MPEVVADPTQRPAVIRDVVALIDTEVDRKGGLSGMAIKTVYKVVKSLKGGSMIPDVVDGLLDEFCGAIEPLHSDFRKTGAGSFTTFLASNKPAAVNALLSITDRRAQRTTNQTLKKSYEKLRPMAETNVAEAVPGIGRLIDRHCA